MSSNISKMRIQNRLEATTRRERALAYAFSQQVHMKLIPERCPRLVLRLSNIQLSYLFVAKDLFKEKTHHI